MRTNRAVALACLFVCSLCLPAEAKPAQAKQAQSKQVVVTCGNCHEAQATPQPFTQMGMAMQVPGKNAALNSHPNLAFTSGPYSYRIETRNGVSQYTVSDGTQSITLPVLWALGAGAQTWVLEKDGKMYESAVSYYPLLNGLSITTGHEDLKPKTIEEAIGTPLAEEGAKACFNCHATNAVVNDKLNLTSLRPGLDCEHCHVGASGHLASVARGDLSSVPPKLSNLTSENLTNFCGQCHRTWETVIRSHWKGVANLRFQPYRLANSKCFDGADPRISCLACHDPHKQVERTAAYYDAKCLACHAPTLQTASVAATHSTASPPKSCPVAKANCTTCHMPKMAITNGHLEFTDHQIRIVKPGEPYPN